MTFGTLGEGFIYESYVSHVLQKSNLLNLQLPSFLGLELGSPRVSENVGH